MLVEATVELPSAPTRSELNGAASQLLRNPKIATATFGLPYSGAAQGIPRATDPVRMEVLLEVAGLTREQAVFELGTALRDNVGGGSLGSVVGSTIRRASQLAVEAAEPVAQAAGKVASGIGRELLPLGLALGAIWLLVK